MFNKLLKDKMNLKKLNQKIFIYTVFSLFTTHIYNWYQIF